MADQQFCLRWNNHQSTLISVFDSLLENGTLVDCTLAAEGKYLKAHKVVLSACSPYLETLLSQHYEKHPIVILKDVKFTELKSMMDYMYRGEVNISQDQLGTFLKAAESLQIKGLSDNGADGDGRDVGSTSKGPPPRKTQPAASTRPVESQRSDLAPASPAHRSRDGSISPSSRKRRRTRRNSQDDDANMGDSHLDSNSCDLPSQAQSTPIVPNIPAAVTSSITTTPIKTIVKPEQTELVNRIDTSNLNSLPPESGLLKEKIEPISEPLLEPKTEYLDDANNDDSVEDLTLDDDDEMDEMDMSNMSNMSNMSRPGPSHGNDVSNQGFVPWQIGNQSGTDEVFMAAQEAVQAHRGDSQGMKHLFDFPEFVENQESYNSCDQIQNLTTKYPNKDNANITETEESERKTSKNTNEIVENCVVSEQKTKIFKDGIMCLKKMKRAKCLDCGATFSSHFIYYHRKLFCGIIPSEILGCKFIGSLGNTVICCKCNKEKSILGIIFHVKYLCGKESVKCLFCHLVFRARPRNIKFSLSFHLKKDHGRSRSDIENLMLQLNNDDLELIEKENISLPLTFGADSYRLETFKDTSRDGVKSSSSGLDKKVLTNTMTSQIRSSHRCHKCSTFIRAENLRLHKKYFCGKDPNVNHWKMFNEGNCYCFNCKRYTHARLIEFHVKYLCGKRPITVQCFYCPKLYEHYPHLLNHMKSIHNKVHFHLDLMSILPEAEDISDGTSLDKCKKVVRHFFSESHPSDMLNGAMELSESTDRNKSSPQNFQMCDYGPQVYTCFYCEQVFSVVYESLDHMEETHSMRHNTYEVLKESIIEQLVDD